MSKSVRVVFPVKNIDNTYDVFFYNGVDTEYLSTWPIDAANLAWANAAGRADKLSGGKALYTVMPYEVAEELYRDGVIDERRARACWLWEE